jgi:hypothetical protein
MQFPLRIHGSSGPDVVAPFESHAVVVGIGLAVVGKVTPDRVRDVLESYATAAGLVVLAQLALGNTAVRHRLGVVEIADIAIFHDTPCGTASRTSFSVNRLYPAACAILRLNVGVWHESSCALGVIPLRRRLQ